MSNQRETELRAYLKDNRNTPQFIHLAELLTMTREKCRDTLEKQDNPETRGIARHCKKMLDDLTE